MITLVAIITAILSMPGQSNLPMTIKLDIQQFQDVDNCEGFKSSAEFANLRNNLTQVVEGSYISINDLQYVCMEK